jgi:hypothetical protein
MRAFILCASALISSLPAAAIERINTPQTECSKIQRVLVRDGAAILRQPSKRVPGLTIYDRHVGDSRACSPADIGKWASVPAKGGKACRVIACVPFEPEDLFPTNHFMKPWLRLKTGG